MSLMSGPRASIKMNWKNSVMMFSKLILLFYILTNAIPSVTCFDNPYELLGVTRTATIPEIKTAYKKLAREWHPDKNKNPAAEETFVEINKAYQLLTDPARREEFDRYGTTEDKPNFRKTPDYSQFHRFNHFDSFFSGSGFRFTFGGDTGGSIYHKFTISSKAYYNNVLAGSHDKLHLIMFYSGFCIPCMQTESLWNRIADEFQPIGIGIACIHAEHEGKLAKKLGVDSVPYIIGVIDGRVKHYREAQFSFQKSIEFTKNLFPAQTITKISSEDALNSFLSGWNQDNKIRVVLCSRLQSIRLRFYTTAFKYRERAVFAYVQLGISETESIVERYGIKKLYTESLLAFHEDSHSPVATLTMAELSHTAINDVIEANKYLLLPRLSSQQVFNSLCPPEPAKTKKHLCVVLVTQNQPADDVFRESMRDYLHSYSSQKRRVQFAYMFEEKQKDFIQAISEGKQSDDASSAQVVIIWRRDSSNIKYEWLKSGWRIEPNKLNSSKESLEATIKRLLQATDALPYNAVIKELKNEHELNIIARMANKVLLFADSIQERVTKEQVLSVVSVVLTAGFIVLVGFGMTYLLKIEEEALSQKLGKHKRNTGSSKSTHMEPSLKIHELRGETYFGLLRLLKPGFRTIILLVDNESKDVLMPKFFKAVFPYRKNKSLMFAFLNLDRNLDWYRGLLIQALTSPRELNIIPKNCIGTVLSINGQRKYFCMYHPKHPEQSRKGESEFDSGGEFIGFDDTESESSDVETGKMTTKLIDDSNSMDSLLFEENLLDKFEGWLDRLFDGSTHRYYFQLWPNLKC